MTIEKLEGVVKVDGLPIVVANFNWSVGFFMEKFIKSLGDKKLLAGKCPVCGYVTTPPRTRCPKCGSKIKDENIIQVGGTARVLSYTTAHVKLDGKGNFVDLKEPIVITAVKLDEADSTLFLPLVDSKGGALEPGAKVQIVWNEATKGAISDIKGVKLV